MRETFKKSLALLLAAVMLFGASSIIGIDFSTLASAASESDLIFVLINGGTEYEVSDCPEDASGDLIIPATHEGKPVTSIGANAFQNCFNLTNITIPDGVTRMENFAFDNCVGLSSIDIPASVTSIGYDAFRDTKYYDNPDNWTDNVLYIGDCLVEADLDCTSCNVAAGTRLIADAAFYYAKGLKEISVPESNANYSSQGDVLFSKDKDLLVAYPMAKTGVSYDIPSSVETIVTYAFYNCGSLESVTVPASVTSVGNYAFQACSNLAEISIPASVTSIGDYAFADCVSLTSINIPTSVRSIGDGAFADCVSLASVNIPASVTSIGYDAFNDTAYYGNPDNWVGDMLYIDGCLVDVGFTSTYIIKEGTRLIAKRSFFYNINIRSITIPASVTIIDDYAFDMCDCLSDVYYGGDESARERIFIGIDNKRLTNATWHYTISVTGVALDITSKTLFAGATQQLTATVAPEDATNTNVTWASSNNAVATVSSTGLVTAKAAGTATITVATADGNKTATCSITVNNPTIAIKNLNNSASINCGDTLKLTAVVTDKPTGAGVAWRVQGSGVSINVSTDGNTCDVTSVDSGTVSVIVIMLDEDGNPVTDAGGNIISAEQQIKSNAGFFQKLIAFFKKLFGTAKIIVQAIDE